MAIEPEATIYLAECLWPDVTRERVEDAARRARAAAADTAENGGARVVFVGSILVPRDEVVFFQFECESAADVERVCLAAGIHFERVIASEHVPAP